MSPISRHDVLVEPLMAIGHEDARHQPILGVSAGAVTNKALLLRQLLVEKQWVVPNECLPSFHRPFLPLPPRGWTRATDASFGPFVGQPVRDLAVYGSAL